MSDRPNGELGGAPRPLTPEQLVELDARAVPCHGITISPDGDALIRGRHELAIDFVVVRVAAEDLVQVAAMMATAALTSLRQLSAATAQVKP